MHSGAVRRDGKKPINITASIRKNKPNVLFYFSIKKSKAIVDSIPVQFPQALTSINSNLILPKIKENVIISVRKIRIEVNGIVEIKDGAVTLNGEAVAVINREMHRAQFLLDS